MLVNWNGYVILVFIVVEFTRIIWIFGQYERFWVGETRGTKFRKVRDHFLRRIDVVLKIERII